MDERLRFVARRLDGEKMAPLCREFGISRNIGYKIFHRCQDCGLEGVANCWDVVHASAVAQLGCRRTPRPRRGPAGHRNAGEAPR